MLCAMLPRRALLLSLSLSGAPLLAVTPGCERHAASPASSTTAPAPTAAAPATAPAPAPPPAPAAVQAPSFRTVIAPFLEVRCASQPHCHGNQPNDDVDIDLRPAAAWSALVGRDSEERPGTPRVKPGDPAQSFLVDKLTGNLHRFEGKQMPRGKDAEPVEPEFIEQALIPWIRAGAPNN